MHPASLGDDAHVAVLAGLRRCARDVFPAGQPLLLAVSGGSDSMALLHAARAELRSPLAVVHVQHGLRAAAPRDAAFVRAACEAHGMPCLVVSAAPTASVPGRGETAARDRRLAALYRAALATGARHVLLAHHRDDALETLLLHVQRGHRGDRALAGIPSLRPLGPRVTLVHPFLATGVAPGRAELAAYRATHRIPHVEDETNADLLVPRNRVRAWLAADGAADVPVLQALQASARLRLAARVARVATQLETGLVTDGLGCQLGWESLQPAAGDAPGEHVAELLRLLGPCLAERRRVDPRAVIVEALFRLALSGRGELSLPATPRPLLVRATRGALLLPDEALSQGDPSSRVLDAVAQLALHLR